MREDFNKELDKRNYRVRSETSITGAGFFAESWTPLEGARRGLNDHCAAF